MTQEWFYSKNEKKFGPFPSSKLLKLVLAGELLENDLVWNKALPNWVPAKKIKGLFPKNEISTTATPPPIPLMIENEQAPLDLNEELSKEKLQRQLSDFEKNEIVHDDKFQQIIPPISENNLVHPINQIPDPSEVVKNSPSKFTFFKTNFQENGGASNIQSFQKTIGEELMAELSSMGLEISKIQCWIPIQKFISREAANDQQGQNFGGFLKSVSNKIISTIEQSSIIDSNRVLILPSFGPWLLVTVGRIGFKSSILKINPEDFSLKVSFSDLKFSLAFEKKGPQGGDTLSFIGSLDFSKAFPLNFGGILDSIITIWLAGRDFKIKGKIIPLPIVLHNSGSVFGSFFQKLDSGAIVLLAIDDLGLHFFNEQIDFYLEYSSILAWSDFDDGILIFNSTDNGVCKLLLNCHGSSELALNLVNTIFTNQNESSFNLPDPIIDAAIAGSSEVEKNSLESNAPDLNFGEIKNNGIFSIEIIKEFLLLHLKNKKVRDGFFVSDLIIPVLPEQSFLKIAITYDGTLFKSWIGSGAICERELDEKFAVYELLSGRYFQTNQGEVFNIDISQPDYEIWQNLCQLTKVNSSVGSNEGVPGILELEDKISELVQVDLNKNGQFRIFRKAMSAIVISLDEFPSVSLQWGSLYGSVGLSCDELPNVILTLPTIAIIDLWREKDIYALSVKTSGVMLGDLYRLYNKIRTEKFLAGLFGNLIITQQQLESDGGLEEFRKTLADAPPGPLDHELNTKLAQKLAILEISRQQISRWFDRCSLFLPHFWAMQDHDWLTSIFGPKIVDLQECEKETLRIQKIIRSELKQVQASLGKSLTELGDNLNSVSFVFPEEVRCAAIASVRNAAGLAEKGAIVAAFGGVGAQLIMGLGKASLGGPLGVAMLGTMGLGLLGSYLQKKAIKKEQQIQLRAYGDQALQWWTVIMDSSYVMAYECSKALDHLHDSNLERDKKILEGLSSDELFYSQKKMTQNIRQWLKTNLQSQFYEVLPGTGLFGHHIVRKISSNAKKNAIKIIEDFGRELPGSAGL